MSTVVAHWIECDGWQAVRAKECTIYLVRRAWHCDRGRFLAQLFPDVGTELARSLDDADGWPRYYFDEARAKLEVEAWLDRRGLLLEQTLEEATAAIKDRIAADVASLDALPDVLGAIRKTMTGAEFLKRVQEALPDAFGDFDAPAPSSDAVRIVVDLPVRTVRLLGVLDEEPAYVLTKLADHAQQGVYRPGAWERGWLVQAFGDDFIALLEQDPDEPYFQRPRRDP